MDYGQRKNYERIIYTTFYDVTEWAEDFKEWCEDNNRPQNKENIHSFIQDEINIWLDDEYINLDIPIDSDIIAIADLGLWNGRKQGYRIIKKQNVNGIFDIIKGYDNVKYFCDQYNVKAELYHHDGVHRVEFRQIRKNKNIQPLLEKLYYNEENVSRETIRRYTTSLRPLIAKIYGW